MPDQRLTYLFDLYIQGSCTPDEKRELAAVALASKNGNDVSELLEKYWEKVRPEFQLSQEKATFIATDIVHNKPESSFQSGRIIRMRWAKIAIAASILLAVGLAGYFLLFNKTAKQDKIVKTEPLKKDVKAPLTNKATITLADGRTIALDSVNSGELAKQSTITVTKTEEGKIVYAGQSSELVYNTLNNPRGSKVIDMTLPDGSRIWLNAGSSVTYPIAFVGKERNISMTGEAYFEVTHNAAMSFHVSVKGLDVEDLGTHFNINAYDDEALIKTTLLEGFVKVAKGNVIKTLIPGEQAQLNQNGEMRLIKNSDVDEAVAWKNGLFQFNHADLPTVMRQLSRWYDIDINYEGSIPDIQFGGKMGRDLSLLEILAELQKNNVHYKIEGKKLTVIP